MTTPITITNTDPMNTLVVTMQEGDGASYMNVDAESKVLAPGESETFQIARTKRIIVEEKR